MAKQGHTLVDLDAHYYDSFDILLECMDDDDPWKEKFEHGIELNQDDSIEAFWPKSVFQRADMGVRRPSHSTQQEIEDSMARLDVDKAILIGEVMLTMGSIQGDDPRPIKYTNAYVDYLLDNIVAPENGLYMTIPMIHSDPDVAVDLIERVGDRESVVGVCLVPAGVQPPFGHRKYDKVWEACSKYDLPVLLHSSGPSLDHYYLDGFKNSLQTQALGFVIANMAQITSMVVQGVPEKFPDLDFVFLEAGLMYIPTLMYRLDQIYMRHPEDAPLLEKKPSEYMKEFYYGTQPLEVPPNDEYMKWTIEMLGGADQVMFASDWPHPDADEPEAITKLSSLSEEEKAKILGKNAEDVFDISGPSSHHGDSRPVEEVIKAEEQTHHHK